MKSWVSGPESDQGEYQTLNERTALRWFLFALRLCEPRVLSELLLKAPALSPGQESTWVSAWVERFWLPDTPALREAVEGTLLHGLAPSAERRWYFEPPPRPPEGDPLEEYFKRIILPDRGGPPRGRVLEVTLPPNPPWSDSKAVRKWETRALEWTRRQVRETIPKWKRTHGLGPELGPEDVWFLLPGSRESVNAKYPMRSVARDLTYLAMKQAGASYSQIPEHFAPALEGRVPDDFLDRGDDPISGAAISKAVRRAAEWVGLAEDRIRHSKPGPPSPS